MKFRKLIVKAAAVLISAMTLSAPAAGAEGVNVIESSRTLYGSRMRIELQVDETYQRKIRNDPDNVKYLSEDDTTASVSDTGLVTAKKPGTCKIRASYGTNVNWYTIKIATFQYKTEDDKVTILKYCGSSKTVNVPESIDDHIVREIASKAFYKNTAVQTVNLPKNITAIGKNVFYGCKNLKKVTYQDKTYTKKQLTALGRAVKAEAEYTAGESPISDFECSSSLINPQAFRIKKYLGNDEKVIVPRMCDLRPICEIYNRAFENNDQLKSVTIPACIERIWDNAFRNCISLTEVNFAGSKVYFEDHVFENCESLEEIVLPDKTDTISRYLFCECVSLKKVVLPESTKVIGDYAFSDCISLKEIHLPKNVESIRSRAFANCTSLRDIYLPDDFFYYDSSAFAGCKDLRIHYRGQIYKPQKKKKGTDQRVFM